MEKSPKPINLYSALLLCLPCLLLIKTSSAQWFGSGGCPDPPVVEYFYFFKFLGTWYEYERYRNFHELFLSCVQIKVSIFDGEQATFSGKEGDVTPIYPAVIERSGLRDIFGFKINSTKTGKLRKADLTSTDSKLFINDNRRDRPFWILDTDYTSYAVIWTCRNFFAFHWEYAWVFVRDRIPSNTTIANIRNAVNNTKLSTFWLKKPDQSKCN